MDSGDVDPRALTSSTALQDPALRALRSLLPCAMADRARRRLLGYLWAWVENQVSAAIKLVPLGQTAGQRMLAALSSCCRIADEATRMSDDELGNCAPGLAIASCLHETQYTPLFRS